MTNHILWTQDYTNSEEQTSSRKKLGLFALLNHLQDIAWTHAVHLGFGHDEMLRSGGLWVLTRQKLMMEEWPKVRAPVQIKTWSRAPRGPVAFREFEIWSEGRKLGECSTSWLKLDLKSRRPLALHFPTDRPLHREEGLLTIEAAKIEARNDASTLSHLEVKEMDLDLNGHVNNTRYAHWIVDANPLDATPTHHLRSYEVNFLAETLLGDRIEIQTCVLPEKESSEVFHHFQGRRESDQKIVFTARLELVPQ